jgi:sporadic carbohydrate cluster 2OG-Fe(II) oxygenase
MDQKKIINSFLKDGYIIEKVLNHDSLKYISNDIYNFLENTKYFDGTKVNLEILNNFNQFVPNSELNKLRLDLINNLKSKKTIRDKFFDLIDEYLYLLVGNELAMQKNINLVIAPPGDSSALLDLHADTWGGNSPFELVVWLPLVDCYDTKSMFMLDYENSKKISLEEKIKDQNSFLNTEDLYQEIKNNVFWPKVNYGEVLLFNPTMPHGARVNNEKETRFSLNCRFKSIFSPYGDKKIGEYFEPINLKPVSKIAFDYLNEKI